MKPPRRRRLPAGVLNILRTYHRAEADELIAGLTWYRDALDHALRLVRKGRRNREIPGKSPIGRRAMAGILAALSPQKTWAQNLRLMLRVVRGDPGGQYSGQVRKALAILGGADPLGVLRGPKERAFFECLADDATEAVTVDGHAYSVWAGKRVFTTRLRIGVRAYRLIAADYRRAAGLCGLRPHQLQAITWLAYRRLVKSVGHAHDRNIPA
jgi:hypothetical protein